jgi:hypothetical protein
MSSVLDVDEDGSLNNRDEGNVASTDSDPELMPGHNNSDDNDDGHDNPLDRGDHQHDKGLPQSPAHAPQHHGTTTNDNTTTNTLQTIDPTSLTIPLSIPLNNIHPNNLIVAPDGAVYVMIKPPNNYQGGPVPHHQNLGYHDNHNNNLMNAAYMTTAIPQGEMTNNITIDHELGAVLHGSLMDFQTPAVDGSSTVAASDHHGNPHDEAGESSNNNNKRLRYTTATAQPSNHDNNVDAKDGPSEQFSSTPRSFVLYREMDERNLSQYQCMARQQMEVFEASHHDVRRSAQGRNRPILVGQVGIRCRHCAKKESVASRQEQAKRKTAGSMYFPNRLDGIYQTAQKLTVLHLCQTCPEIPDDIRRRLLFLKDQKSSDGGGKMYWADGVRSLGVVETRDGLSFVAAVGASLGDAFRTNTNG